MIVITVSNSRRVNPEVLAADFGCRNLYNKGRFGMDKTPG